MAANTLQAKRYAQAIFEIALEKKELDKWQADLQRIAVLTQDAEFVAVMDNPKYSFEAKSKLISNQIGQINPLAKNLAFLLISRGLFSIIQEVYAEYQLLLDNFRGIEKADITTAVPLSDAEKNQLTESLRALTGKKIILSLNVDPSIIGGLVIRVGGRLIDGSTNSQLAALKGELAGMGR